MFTHFEIFVEDHSGKVLLDTLFSKLLPDVNFTDTIHSYRGSGTSSSELNNVIVCLAIEEMEAWLLGDFEAIRKVYPQASRREYDTYIQDSVCGTWEKLAKVIDEKLYSQLQSSSYNIVGSYKAEWAKKIAPEINIRQNRSQSFQYLVHKVDNVIRNS